MNEFMRSQLFGTLGVESAEVQELNEATEVDEETLEEPVEAESSVAEAIEDVEADSEVETLDDQAEDLDDATDGLEELDAALEGYGNGGKSLSPIEAAALKLTINQTVNRFVKDTGNLIPATEDFKEDAGGNTTLAVEALKDTAKGFGDSVAAAARNVWEKIKTLVEAIVNRFRGIVSRADRVIVAAKAAKGSVTGTIEFNKDKVSVNGEASGQVLREGLERMRTVLDTYKTESRSEEAFNIIQELAKPEHGEKVSTKLLVDKQNEFLNGSFTKVFGETTEKEGALVAKPFPGEWTPSLIKASAGGMFSYERLERVKPKEKGGDVKIDAIAPQEVVTLAGLIKLLQKSLADYKGYVNQNQMALKRLSSIRVAESRAKSTKESREEMGVSSFEAEKQGFMLMRRQGMFVANLVSSSNQLSLNVLELCEKSIKLVSEGGETKTPEDGKEQAPTAE